MGYRLLVTEFDVKDKALPANIAQRDEKVADFARRYFDVMLDYRQHLDDVLACTRVDRLDDAVDDGLINEEVLPESLASAVRTSGASSAACALKGWPLR